MKGLGDWIVKLGRVDRRVLFLIVAVSVMVPLFYPLGLPIRAGKGSRDVFETIEALPPGSRVLMSFDYGPSTKPELHPMAVGVMRHVLRNKHKLYVMCLWPDGVFLAEEAVRLVAEHELHLEYGKDYVTLGFRPGNEAIIKGVVSDLRKVFTVDTRGTLIGNIPMMEGVTRFADFTYLFGASAGYPGAVEWVQYAADPTGIPFSTGTTSIQVNEVMPYVQGGQIKGILAGMPGAAEYEALIERPGIGTSGMDAQSIAHLVIVAFIVFGNVAYSIERRRSGRSGGSRA